MEQNATKCIAFLMDWKNSHCAPRDFDSQLLWELEEDPFSAAQMKKLWSYEKLPDGSVCITGYKGDDPEVVIPERIGKSLVTAIGDEAFSTAKKGRTHARKDLLELIESLVIPEGVTSIGMCAFYGCRSLNLVAVPASVTYISPSAFRMCPATFRGNPGSYAEQFAKEHGIRFWVI